MEIQKLLVRQEENQEGAALKSGDSLWRRKSHRHLQKLPKKLSNMEVAVNLIRTTLAPLWDKVYLENGRTDIRQENMKNSSEEFWLKGGKRGMEWEVERKVQQDFNWKYKLGNHWYTEVCW